MSDHKLQLIYLFRYREIETKDDKIDGWKEKPGRLPKYQ